MMRSAWTRVAAVALSTVIATGLILAMAGPASAASPEVLLSDDGVNFSTGLPGGLFDDLGLLVPGESVTTTLWVKNPTVDFAVARVSVGALSVPSAAFAAGVTLTTLDVGTAATSRASFAELQRCAVLVPSHTLGAREVLRIDFTVTMSESVSGSDAQGQAAVLDFQVAMRDAAAGAFPNAECVSPSTPPAPTVPANPGLSTTASMPAGVSRRLGSGLAYTGQAPATFLFPCAGVLIGVGIFCVVRRRRRKPGES
ncbi:hypothetical protein [Salinibacterium sp.]|uniref:hypothetical protein n=1 Tax=Salinibacterium sp. TaxID=1915057 RepID=UPI00286C1426|nr:hypothetical protein [Salinibacterium sp.]